MVEFNKAAFTLGLSKVKREPCSPRLVSQEALLNTNTKSNGWPVQPKRACEEREYNEQPAAKHFRDVSNNVADQHISVDARQRAPPRGTSLKRPSEDRAFDRPSAAKRSRGERNNVGNRYTSLDVGQAPLPRIPDELVAAADSHEDAQNAVYPADVSHARYSSHLWKLPTEILEKVADSADNEGLYSLTAVCKDLREICTPIYFKRQGFKVPVRQPDLHFSGTVDISTVGEFAALPLWFRSSTFGPVHSFFLTFSSDPEESTRQAKILSKFFASLDSPPFVQNIYMSISDAFDAHHLLGAVQNFHRTGCRDIDFNGWHAVNAMVPKRQRILNMDFPRIDKFIANSDILFTPSLACWTIATLSHSQIRNLSLMSATLSEMQWSLLLSQLYMPSLHSLTVGGTFKIRTLLTFLDRHPDLRRVEVCWGQFLGNCPAKLPKINLPYLTELSGPPGYVAVVLDRLRATPNLRTISIIPDSHETTRLIGAFNEIVMAGLFDTIDRQCEVLEHLEVRFPRIQDIDPFFLHVEYENDCREERYLTSITTLLVRCDDLYSDPFDETVMNQLPGWIALFPSLSRVELLELRQNDRSAFIHSVTAACSHLPGLNVSVRSLRPAL